MFPRPARHVLGQALLLPITDFPALGRAFWPTLIPIGIGFVTQSTADQLGGWVDFLRSAGLLILLLVLISRGLVAWHRWCVLGERPSLTGPEIGSRNVEYLLCWIGVGLRFVVLYIAIVVPIVFLPMAVLGVETIGRMADIQLATVVIAYVLLAVVFARAFSVSSLRLVSIAVGAKQYPAVVGQDEPVQPWLWQVVAAGILIGETTSGIGDIINATNGTGSEIADGAIASFALVFSFVVFATVLSVYHRNYVQGQGRVIQRGYRLAVVPVLEQEDRPKMMSRVGGEKLDALKLKYPDADTFVFGDSRDLCNELLALVKSGHKTATCGALREYVGEGKRLPEVSRRDIALDWDGMPVLVIETTEVTQHRFCDVDAGFALAEGENSSLEGWREDHERYFERNGGFDPEMMLVCERFRLIEVVSR